VLYVISRFYWRQLGKHKTVYKAKLSIVVSTLSHKTCPREQDISPHLFCACKKETRQVKYMGHFTKFSFSLNDTVQTEAATMLR